MVFGEEHALLGEIPIAKIVVKDSIGEEDVKEFCRQVLSEYKVPKKISFVKEINKTYNGKTLRRDL